MAHRSFTLTLNSNYQNLFTLISAITGAVPTDGILPDRVQSLCITPAVANSTSAVLISDRNSANATGSELLTPQTFKVVSNRNSICLRDYTLKGNTLVCSVDLEYT